MRRLNETSLEVTETPSEGFLGARGPSRRNFGPSGPHFLCFYAFYSLFLLNPNTSLEKMQSSGPASADFLSVPADSLPVPAVSSRSLGYPCTLIIRLQWMRRFRAASTIRRIHRMQGVFREVVDSKPDPSRFREVLIVDAPRDRRIH